MSSNTPKATVNTPCLAYNDMEDARKLPRALMGGTKEMRKHKEYLPQEPAESDKAYEIRLGRSVLYNAYKKAVLDLSGKVFSKPVSCDDDVPDDLKEWCENIDLAGRDLHSFAHGVFRDAFYGVTYILVDFPSLPAGRTLAEERAIGARPYCVHIKCQNFIAWKSERIGGVETLTHARIRESAVVPDGDYGEKTVERVRQLDLVNVSEEKNVTTTRCQYQVFEKQKVEGGKEEWILQPELSGVMSIGFIPIVAVYTDRTDFMQGMPPLADLADLNALHWQSSSDQERILHFARVPLLFGRALGEDGTQVEIGPSRMIQASSEQADLKYVEHSGAAIGAGKESLASLEEQMSRLAMAPLIVGKTGTITATEKAIDTSEAHSTLQAWALMLQDSFEQVLQYMGAWVGYAPEDCGGVVVDTDYGIVASGMELPQLTDAFQKGLLSKETVWAELKRRGLLSDDFDPGEETANLENDARQQPGPSGAGGLADKILAGGQGQKNMGAQGDMLPGGVTPPKAAA